jgi:hypothetical protein
VVVLQAALVTASAAAPALPVAAATHSNTAFAVVFGIFVVAILILAVVIITWAVKRDRVGLAEWRRKRMERAWRTGGPAAGNGARGPASGNGHKPGAAPGGAATEGNQ